MTDKLPYITIPTEGLIISTESKNLFRALSLVKKELPALVKDRMGVHSDYADINQVMEVLKPIIDQNGIEIFQPVVRTEGLIDGVMTFMTHLDTGQYLSFTSGMVYPLKDRNQWGGDVTYTRRYAIVSFFGMEQEDNDSGQSSSESNSKPQRVPITEAHVKELQVAIKAANNPAELFAEILKETRINNLEDLSDKQFYFVLNRFLK